MTHSATQPRPSSQYPHLTPRRLPGPQTRRRGVLGPGGGKIVFVVFLLFGVITAVFGVIFLLFSLALIASGDLVGVLIGVVVALLSIAVPAGSSSRRGGCAPAGVPLSISPSRRGRRSFVGART